MKSALAVSVALLLAVTAFSAETIWFEGSFDDALQLAKSQNKLVLVDFSAHG